MLLFADTTKNTSINRNVLPLMLVVFGNTAQSLRGIALYGFRQNVKLMRYCLRILPDRC